MTSREVKAQQFAEPRTAPAVGDAGATAEMLDFVASAARALRGRSDPASVARHTARIPVPVLADLTLVLVNTGGDAPILEIGHQSAGERARVRAVLESRRDALFAALARVGAVEGNDQPRWIPRVTPETLAEAGGAGPELTAAAAELGITSLLIHPLSAHGRIMGVLVLARVHSERPYDAGEFAAGLMLARRAALALEEVGLRAVTPAAERRRSRIEEALAKWSHTFEAASWAAAILDATDWRLESANKAFARLHGYAAAEDLIGRPLIDFVAPAVRDDVQQRISDSPDEALTLETSHVRRDGAVFPVLLNITAPRATGGGAYRAVHLQDLSELRRTEERLHSAQRMEAVGRLAGGVAHEVNNMMTIVLGFSEFLLRDGTLSPLNRDDVGEIQRAAERAAGITRQLLAYSRQQVLRTSVLDLSEVVGGASQFLRALLPSNVFLKTRLEAREAWVCADRNQLEQVLINLAFNARDAMPEGGTLTLETSLERLSSAALRRRIGIPIEEGEYAAVSVRDTGIGMDAETLEHLFEPFYTTKGMGKGTGLGLSTVYGIVKQSGGYVTAASAPGKGSTFCIYLPSVRAPEDGEAALTETEAAGGTETLLVVEDEEAVRVLAGRALRDQGYVTLEATDGAAALGILAERGREVDLIVSDLVMPLVGGRELRSRLAELGLSIPVLSMSAYTGDEARARGMLGAGDPFIQKPFTPAMLIREVRTLLDAARPSVVAR